jgi:D-ribose pyranose/furanose isomerase RbsD
MKPIARLFAVLFATLATLSAAEPALAEKIRTELPKLGHRNWIVVADSAYPLQNAEGIQTITTETNHLDAVSLVIAELAKTKHVKPTILTDSELQHVAEKHAPGITTFRENLTKILDKQPSKSIPHEDIIADLDKAGKTFRVLLIKTPLTLPYTSVFFPLECGYWTSEAEAELRRTMSEAGKK